MVGPSKRDGIWSVVGWERTYEREAQEEEEEVAGDEDSRREDQRGEVWIRCKGKGEPLGPVAWRDRRMMGEDDLRRGQLYRITEYSAVADVSPAVRKGPDRICISICRSLNHLRSRHGHIAVEVANRTDVSDVLQGVIR